MSEENAKEKIVERIRKILDKVNHEGGATATPEAEVETALRFARKLMEQYNVDEADLATKPEGQDALYSSYTVEVVYSRAGKIDPFDIALARVLRNICEVGYYRSEDYQKDELGNFKRNKKGGLIDCELLKIYGAPRDVAVAKALYMELLTTMRTMARWRLGGYTKEYPAYATGFVDNLVLRSAAMKKESVAESNTTAIVLVKENLLKRKAEELGLAPGRARRSRSADANTSAYATGHADGANVSLGTNGIAQRATPTPKAIR